jgi:catechol 2,3-dioxygenase-like lactoylglutathione lyase family enzyme
MQAYAQITWFYYHDLQKAAHFYEDILQFNLVEDQGMARIYKIGQASYFGIVDPNGHCQPQKKNAALLTLVVDQVSEWHIYLKNKGVQVSDILEGKKVKQHFFLQDPSGYEVEIQTFRDQHVQTMFEG